MSVPEAYKVLGVPHGASPEEISKAYKLKALEVHPDRGGSHEKMVELNVAKDVVDGKGKGSRPWDSPQPRRERPPPPKTVDTIKGETFDHATSSVPSGVAWKFISKPEYVSDSSLSFVNRYADVWILYGQTDTKHVFVAVKRRGQNLIFDHDKGGNVEIEKDWQGQVEQVALSKDLLKAFPAAIKGMMSTWGVKQPPKKYVSWPGGMLSEAVVEKVRSGSGGASLKDILIGEGLVDTSKPGVAGRKTIVEMYFKYSKERRDRMQKQRGPKGLYSHHVVDFYVRVNGKEFMLSDDTIENLDKNHFIMMVFSNNVPADGPPRQLNRLREGRFKIGPTDAIRLLTEALTSEPTALILALTKAAEEWEDEGAKKAAYGKLVAATSLEDAALFLGVTPIEVFHDLNW